MQSDLFNDMPTNRIDRGERSHWILEDHRNLFATNLTHLVIAALEEIFAFEEDLT